LGPGKNGKEINKTSTLKGRYTSIAGRKNDQWEEELDPNRNRTTAKNEKLGSEKKTSRVTREDGIEKP